MMKLSQDEALRYQRQLILIGSEGQTRLKTAKVLCVGAGGLAHPALQYLVAAGVGTLGIMDNDLIEISNLHRQIHFTTTDIGRPKATVIATKLQQQNPHVKFNVYDQAFSTETASLITDYDVILDGSDNYRTRYLLNDACHLQQKPLISASIFQWQGQLSVFNYLKGPCYRCLYPTPPTIDERPSCAEAGVLGVLPGVMGTLQATEVLKILLQQGESLSGRLLTYDALSAQFQTYHLLVDSDCPLCQRGELSMALHSENTCSQERGQPARNMLEVSAEQLAKWLNQYPSTLQLLDVRETYEREAFHIGGEHLPLSAFDPEQLNFDKTALTVVYCKAGGRSLQAVEILRQMGYQQAMSLKGGMLAWQALDT
ncbi:MAG: HesA/MoeB/ThiF family protein [Gammaproteobacteria bacterium]